MSFDTRIETETQAFDPLSYNSGSEDQVACVSDPEAISPSDDSIDRTSYNNPHLVSRFRKHSSSFLLPLLAVGAGALYTSSATGKETLSDAASVHTVANEVNSVRASAADANSSQAAKDLRLLLHKSVSDPNITKDMVKEGLIVESTSQDAVPQSSDTNAHASQFKNRRIVWCHGAVESTKDWHTRLIHVTVAKLVEKQYGWCGTGLHGTIVSDNGWNGRQYSKYGFCFANYESLNPGQWDGKGHSWKHGGVYGTLGAGHGGVCVGIWGSGSATLRISATPTMDRLNDIF